MTWVFDSWQELNVLMKLGALLCLASIIPTFLAFLRLERRPAVEASTHGVVSRRSPAQTAHSRLQPFRWAVVNVCALFFAVALFWSGWQGVGQGIDCAGPACARALARLRGIYLAYASLFSIPFLGLIGWLAVGRRHMRSARRDA